MISQRRIFSQDDVFAYLEPHHDALHSVVTNAWKRWPTLASAIAIPSARFRAQAIHELMLDEVRSCFQNTPKTRVVEVNKRRGTDRTVSVPVRVN